MQAKDSSQLHIPSHTYQTGVALLIAAIIMVYAAITSALVIRHASAQDWGSVPLSRAVYFIAVLLIVGSVRLQLGGKKGMAAGVVVGIGILCLNGIQWKQLLSARTHLASSPAASAFYLLTGIFALLLLSAVVALAWTMSRHGSVGAKFEANLSAMRLYWHFLTALWIYILLLLNRW